MNILSLTPQAILAQLAMSGVNIDTAIQFHTTLRKSKETRDVRRAARSVLQNIQRNYVAAR